MIDWSILESTGTDESDRKQLVKDANVSYRNSLREIMETLSRVFPLGVLTCMAHYGLQIAIDRKGHQRKITAGVEQFHVELLQAIVLSVPLNRWGRDLPSSYLSRIIELVGHLSSSSMMKQIPVGNMNDEVEDMALRNIQVRIRLHTQGVRNSDYYRYTIREANDLYRTLDPMSIKTVGFGFTDIILVTHIIVRELERRNNYLAGSIYEASQCQTAEEALETYCSKMRVLDSENNNLISDPSTKPRTTIEATSWILNHGDANLYKNYIFTSEDVSYLTGLDRLRVEKIFKTMSLKPGDLDKAVNEDIMLDNPVWRRPMIDMGEDNYCIPMPQMVFSHLTRIISELAHKTNTKNTLFKRRSQYLEDKVAQIVETTLPDSRQFKNFTWTIKNEIFETDLIMIIDRTVFIFESKSGHLSSSGARGKSRALKRFVKELILNPSVQSQRLKTIIECKNSIDSDAREICKTLKIMNKDIDQVIRVSVTLDDLSILYSAVNELKSAEWIPEEHDLPLTVYLGDFRHVCEILDNPIFFAHYLFERAYLQKENNVMGNELHFLETYLGTGLNLNLPDESVDVVLLSEYSDKVERYFVGKDEGIEIAKPKPKIEPYFASVLRRLGIKKPKGWLSAGMYLLSCCPYEEQAKVEKNLNRLRKSVRRKWRKVDHDCMLVIEPKHKRKCVVIFYVFPARLRGTSRVKAEQGAVKILNEGKYARCCVFLRCVDDWEKPYEAIVMVKSLAT